MSRRHPRLFLSALLGPLALLATVPLAATAPRCETHPAAWEHPAPLASRAASLGAGRIAYRDPHTGLLAEPPASELAAHAAALPTAAPEDGSQVTQLAGGALRLSRPGGFRVATYATRHADGSIAVRHGAVPTAPAAEPADAP